MLKHSSSAPHIEYYYVWVDAWGIHWHDVVTNIWIQKNAARFGPVLQQRAATSQEINEHIQRYIISIE